jgi:signal transduction histidine kinase/ligand-binding sensor domain-containing protein/DNA-binding response OmpR family regulator
MVTGYIFRFLFLFLWAAAALTALDPEKQITQYSVQVLNMEAGLPGNSVYAVCQTPDGYLWLGTPDGLVRFDGIDFLWYSREKFPSVKITEARALYVDRDGTLWIGATFEGLIRYKAGEFTTYSIATRKSLDKIRAIEEDPGGNLWIGSITGGLTRMSQGEFTTYTTTEGLPDNEVRAIYKDSKGCLWITTKAGIVKMSEPGHFQAVVMPGDFPYLTVCLYNADLDEFWVGTGENYLHRVKNGRSEVFEGILHPTVNCLYEDSSKNLWIGTDGGGLVRINKLGVSSMLAGGDMLTSGAVYAIFEDREGSLWVGTLDGGLLRFGDSKFTTTTRREGLAHDYIQCVYEDRAGDMWIGTKEGLNRLKNGKVVTVLTTREGLLDKTVTCFYEDPAGNLWIGTWGGLHRYRDRKMATFTTKDGLSDNRIKCIQGDRQGKTWIGTEKGLNRYDPASRTFTVYTTEQGLSHDIIEFIYEDSRGKLWIGTDGGLDCLEGGVISAKPQMEKKIFHNAYEDREGVLWLGTESGLIRIKEKETAPMVFTYTIQDGLIENYVYSIIEDDSENLWLGGRNGISRVSKKELEELVSAAGVADGKIPRLQPVWYNVKDGMKSSWCTGTAIKTRDHRLWFPTSVGITSIDPQHIKTNLLAPAVMIERLAVDGEHIDLYSMAKGKNPLKLGPGISRLEFYYAGVSLIEPKAIRYKIRLADYDRDWIDMGDIRHTTYTNLAPGAYTFSVIAANPDGVWNRDGAAFSFYIRPYFHQTPWFYLVTVLFIILGIYFLYRLKFRRLKARQAELRRLVALRTRDLQERNLELEKTRQTLEHSKELIEAKNLQLESQTVQLKEQSEKLKEMDRVKSRFFTNISHEFRTPLTLIMGPLEQMLSISREPKEKKNLNLMLRNSQRLLGLINQLLELSKLESGKAKLQASRRNVIPLLKGITANFEPLANTRELDLSFHAAEDDITLYVDAGKLEEVISNLLINAVKFTPAGGKITVEAGRDTGKDEAFPSGNLQISVRDTGTGISREQLTHIFDRFYQAESTYENQGQGTGVGLALVKELVQLHHGKIDVYSHEGKGTEFIISLPMGEGHLQPGEIIEPVDRVVPGEAKEHAAGMKPGVPAGIDLQAAELADLAQLDETVDEAGAEIAAVAAPENGPLPPGKEIILVVEDNPEVRGYIRGELEPGYTVIEAADGPGGIAKAMEIIPDLVISDIMMPGCDGYELCRTLKKDIKTSHIPIILLTAKASEENIVQGLETGADDYITKPFNARILAARIRNLIELRRQMQLNIHREMTLRPVEIAVSGIDKEFLKELKEVINQNLADSEFNVEGLARKLYMDRSTVYRKVLALTGEVPTEFIKSCRLKRAAELLKGNFGTVLEVALEVGFSSANYFTKCFKQKFHCLPSTYSAAHRF